MYQYRYNRVNPFHNLIDQHAAHQTPTNEIIHFDFFFESKTLIRILLPVLRQYF